MLQVGAVIPLKPRTQRYLEFKGWVEENIPTAVHVVEKFKDIESRIEPLARFRNKLLRVSNCRQKSNEERKQHAISQIEKVLEELSMISGDIKPRDIQAAINRYDSHGGESEIVNNDATLSSPSSSESVCEGDSNFRIIPSSPGLFELLVTTKDTECAISATAIPLDEQSAFDRYYSGLEYRRPSKKQNKKGTRTWSASIH